MNVLHSVNESRQILGGIGRKKFYELVNSGHIRLTRIGRRSMVHDDDLKACADRLRAESPARNLAA